MQSFQKLRSLPTSSIYRTLPHLASGKRVCRKAGHDTEVAGTAFECTPEVRILPGRCRGNTTVGKDDLVLDDVVTDEADLRGKEGDATYDLVNILAVTG